MEAGLRTQHRETAKAAGANGLAGASGIGARRASLCVERRLLVAAHNEPREPPVCFEDMARLRGRELPIKEPQHLHHRCRAL